MKRPEHRDLAARLPEDVLADVLRRVVAPRWLAISRCVCKAWRAIIDGDGLLCTELPFNGIFIAFTELPLPEFFPRPPSPVQPAVSGKLDFLPTAITDDSDEFIVQDHCNGLLLLSTYKINPVRRATYVVNPATRTWDPLPSYPPIRGIVRGICFHNYHLAFDPKVSSSYQVLGIPWLFSGKRDNESEYDPLEEEELSEWPPSPYILPVFSSKTRCWEMRPFSRHGDAAGTVAEMRAHFGYHKLHSVYWRGSLYVHCQSNLVMRISMSEDKYTVIKPPMGVQMCPYLGRSEKGVYLAALVERSIRVFILNIFSDRADWTLKHDYDLNPLRAFRQQVHGPWILEDINFHFFPPEKINEKLVIQENSEWDSDNEDFADIGDAVEACPAGYIDIEILGFHPYKEILFLSRSETCKQNAMAFAYHLNSFKIEILGSIYPTDYDSFDSGLANVSREIESFPYTPCCWIEQIPETAN
ncbi:hypothetical protein VPH35_049047 [Triticum aestivum]